MTAVCCLSENTSRTTSRTIGAMQTTIIPGTSDSSLGQNMQKTREERYYDDDDDDDDFHGIPGDRRHKS